MNNCIMFIVTFLKPILLNNLKFFIVLINIILTIWIIIHCSNRIFIVYLTRSQIYELYLLHKVDLSICPIMFADLNHLIYSCSIDPPFGFNITITHLNLHHPTINRIIVHSSFSSYLTRIHELHLICQCGLCCQSNIAFMFSFLISSLLILINLSSFVLYLLYV